MLVCEGGIYTVSLKFLLLAEKKRKKESPNRAERPPSRSRTQLMQRTQYAMLQCSAK